MNPLYAGIDIASKENWVCFMDKDGNELSTFSFANDLSGAVFFKDACLALAKRHQFDELIVGMEATAMYWWHLSAFIATEETLAHLKPKVYSINPTIVKGFKESYTYLPKTDRVDAWVIADRLRFGRLPAECYRDEKYQPLQRLTRFRHRLIQQITAEKNYFLSYLFLKFNNYQGIFSNTFGSASQAVLSEFYSVDEIAEADIEKLVSLLKSNSNSRFTDPAALAGALRQAAKDAYRLDERTLEPVNFILATTLKKHPGTSSTS